MKHFNKQILEAINRGVALALDDFDYNDELSITTKKSIVKNNNELVNVIQTLEKRLEKLTLTSEELDTLTLFHKLNHSKYKIKSNLLLRDIVNYIVGPEGINSNADLNWLDTSKVTDMIELFKDTPFNGDISEWDVSHVKNMANMFANCTEFTGENTDLSNWNTHNVVNMAYMFHTCSFNGIHNDLANWNVSKVCNMENMFSYCIFNGDISKWNVSKVNNTKYMFMYSAFNLDISNWKLNDINESTWMFAYGQFNLDISKWNGEKLSVRTFKYSKLDFEHLPKYWLDDIKIHPLTKWK